MINVFDITEFGAVGDGATDCTAAIQAALDRAADCMGQVIVPPGHYKTGKLKMHGKGVSMRGSSAWSFRSDGASVLHLNDETADCLMDITGAFGCSISGVSMNGEKLGKNIHGIKIYWDEYNGGGEEDTPTIDDCRIGYFSGDGVHFEHVWCFSVRHSMLHHNEGAGLFIDGWDAFILDNWLSCNLNGGLRAELASSLTLTGNRVEWNHAAGFILPRGSSYNITGNFFDRSYGPAIYLGGGEKPVDLVSITGNVFRRSGAYDEAPFEDENMSCHVLLHNCTGVAMTGNTMRLGRGDRGIGNYSPIHSMIIRDCADSIVKDNTMHNGSLGEKLLTFGDNASTIIADNIG